MSLKRNLITLVIGTTASRILGFIRDILIAGILGAGPVADAFVVAFRLPNLFRRLFAEGAFNSAFVPLFSKELNRNGEAAAHQFANEAWAFLFSALAIFVILAEIFMPQFVMIMAPGFASDHAKFELTVFLTRICFPYLMCMSLLALLASIQNSKGHFKASAFAPTALNIILSIAALVSWYLDVLPQEAGVILIYSILIAGFVQLGILLLAAKNSGYLPTQFIPKFTPNVKRLITFGAPSILSAGVTQINIVVGTMLASSMAGAVSYLYYADRLYQLPLGIVATAIGTALLPPITAHIVNGKFNDANALQNQGFIISLMLTLPATMALLIIPNEICMVLFERGAFTQSDTIETSKVLAAYALGLPGFVLIKVLSPAYFARENSKTPFYYASISVAINVIASLILAPLMGASGIALATSLAAWSNALLLAISLIYKKNWQPTAQLWMQTWLCFMASGIMGASLYYLLPYTHQYLSSQNEVMKALALASLIFAGMTVYLVSMLIFNGQSVKAALAAFTKRGK